MTAYDYCSTQGNNQNAGVYTINITKIFEILFILIIHMSSVKRIFVFEHSVMTNFNCACPAIQRGQGSGFLSEGSS